MSISVSRMRAICRRCQGPAIIIAASGMAEAGRILHHLRNHVEDDRNTIVVVGFMAQHTLGRRIVERRPQVKVWGMDRVLRARVEVLNSFSAHADRDDLLAFADACGADTRKFLLVHGEPKAQASLRDAMTARGMTLHVAARGQTSSWNEHPAIRPLVKSDSVTLRDCFGARYPSALDPAWIVRTESGALVVVRDRRATSK